MGLRLILGRAGSGKSTQIYKEINELVAADPGGRPLWLLVPEQATSQAERNLAASGPLPGIMRARVVSFQRLAYQMLHEVAGAALVQVGELGRHMIIRRVVEQHKQELRTFYRAAQQPGFTSKLAELVSELKSCQITPDDLAILLQNQAERLTPTLQNKLHDLALLCSHLAEQYGETYLDAGDCLNLLAGNLAKSPSLAGSQIWLDGFNGFTPQEYAVIAQMLVACPQVNISLTMPPALLRQRVRDDHVFYSPWETAHRLMQLARDLGVDIEPPLVPAELNLRSQTNEALQYLERHYFNRLAEPYQLAPERIQIIAAGNRRAEVEAAAAEILRLCREENYRYRDISVTLRDFADYDYLLTTVLTDFGIPHFLDRKRKVDQHPALELVRSALETVLENFLYEPVFRCLKTGLFPCQREAVDMLENYVLATGIRGGNRWLDSSDWVPQPEGVDQGAREMINGARRLVADHLGRLANDLQAGKTARDYTVAVYTFLDALEVESQLLAWAEQAANRGELEAASLHTQVWSALVGLLDELVAGLGEEELPLAEYARILDSGLEAIELGLIPPELDQVIITSLGRSRNPEVKAALVLGVTEGVLPARAMDDGLLTEHERQLLASCNLELGLSGQRRLFNEQFLIYTALTRPSERLWLSYPLADEAGASLLPSPVIKRVRALFPQLEVEEHPITPDNLEGEAVLPYLAHPSQALDHLAVRLREATLGRPTAPIWWDTYSYLLLHSHSRPALLKVLASLQRRNVEEPLTPTVVHRLYGKTLRASISRIERYHACPFAFFSAYGLRLKERPIYQLAALDLGNFFHDAMDRFVFELDRRGLDWGQLNDEQYNQLTRHIVDELSPEIQNHILDSSSRYRHIARKLERTVERSARVLGRHASRGKFRPIGVELVFGPEGQIPGLSFTLADGTRMELAGRIDRLDVATAENGQTYLRVIDYKSGSSKLTPLEAYYGLKLQLLTYLHVAEKCAADLLPANAKAAGALYFRIYDPLQKTEQPVADKAAESLGLESYRMQGFLINDPAAVELMDEGLQGRSQLIPVTINADGSIRKSDDVWDTEELAKLRLHLEQQFVAAGNEILQGNIAISPYRLHKETACRFCVYRAVCQFDALLPENSYRWLPHLPREEVMARIELAQGGEPHE